MKHNNMIAFYYLLLLGLAYCCAFIPHMIPALGVESTMLFCTYPDNILNKFNEVMSL